MGSQLEGFIKKYKSAVANRSKEIRLSIEEATDILSAFATMNTSAEDLSKILATLKSTILQMQNNTKISDNFDGGRFK